MEPGIPAILTSGTLKAGNGFARTRQMTGLEKETGVRECGAESPFCYKENCLLYIPENLKPMKKGSREEAEQLAGQIRNLVCSTYGHTLVLFTSRLSWCRICRKSCVRDLDGRSARSRIPALCPFWITGHRRKAGTGEMFWTPFRSARW